MTDIVSSGVCQIMRIPRWYGTTKVIKQQ